MQHSCTIPTVSDSLTEFFKRGIGHKLRKLTLIYPKNPLCAKYFRSEKAIKNETKRQLQKSKWFIIHPLSRLRAWYEFYLIFLYFMNILYLPVVSGYLMRDEDLTNYIKEASWTVIILTSVDVIMYFITGYIDKKSNTVELRPKYIAKKYICSMFFFYDVLPLLPRKIPNYYNTPVWYFGLVNILNFLKMARISTLVNCTHRTVVYLRWNISEKLIVFEVILLSFIMIHYLSCIRNMIPMFGYYFWYDEKIKEIYLSKLIKSFPMAYKHNLLTIIAQMIGIPIEKNNFPEEYLFSMFTYVLGRLVLTATWVILAVKILSKRSLKITFIETINQLDQYMTQKGFPIDLQKKLNIYYQYKYHNKYFKEQYVHSILTSDLQSEANLYACRSLISKVSIFANLTHEQITKLLPKMTREIFLPKDVIYQAGTEAHYMYFISSGTVAVYTRSGKEICHIQDGGHFNEMTLLLKKDLHICTVISIEMTEVYRLPRRDFERHLVKWNNVHAVLVEAMEIRLKLIKKLEADYKTDQFKTQFGAVNIKLSKRPSKTNSGVLSISS